MLSKKIIIKCVLFLVFVLIILNAQLIGYGLMQLRGQLKVSLNAVPISEALNDNALTEEQKKKLALIEPIREFAFTELGLKRNSNYTKFYLQDDNTKMWVVSACERFAFIPHEWSFPIVGSFPYKGFFNKSSAEKEKLKLEVLDYDTRIGIAGGWSTLGWFNDPVLSGMLKRNEGSLAELIIHELSHGSVFIKDSIEYNENLATFIGEQGAILFLASYFTNENTYLDEYIHGDSDYKMFANHMLNGAKKLERLYETFNDSMSDAEKQKLKDLQIDEIVDEIENLGLHDPDRYLKRFRSGKKPNNADFMSFKRYRDQQHGFEAILMDRFNGDLKSMIAWLIQKHPA